MSILQKSETDNALERTERKEESVKNALSATMVAMDSLYRDFWGMPDEILTAVLQRMLNEGVLQDTFARHYVTATALNAAAEAAGLGQRLATAVGREFSVDSGGTISLVPLPPDVTLEELPILPA